MARSTPLEPMMSSNQPMSAGEGGLILLVGGALIGVGYLIGVTKAWKQRMDEKAAEPPQRRPTHYNRTRGNNPPQSK